MFPDLLKLADVISLHKTEEKTRKKNYRSVSVLPTVSKVFERLLEKHIIDYMTPYLSSLLCGFRKGYNFKICTLYFISYLFNHLYIITLSIHFSTALD